MIVFDQSKKMFQNYCQKKFSDQLSLQIIQQFSFAEQRWFVLQNVALNDCRRLKDFDFLTTVLVRSGGGNGKRRSISDGSVI